METWEYFTTSFVADTELVGVPVIDGIPGGEHPRYSVYTLIPQLNYYGAQGWELISLEPMQIGKNGDMRTASTASTIWANQYFATFKRRTNG